MVLISLQLIIFSCDDICKQYLEKTFRPLSYNMVVTRKYIDTKFYRIIGKDSSGIIDTTEEGAIDGDVYEQIEIGDTIFKKKGNLDIILIKKDTVITFPNFCN